MQGHSKVRLAPFRQHLAKLTAPAKAAVEIKGGFLVDSAKPLLQSKAEEFRDPFAEAR